MDDKQFDHGTEPVVETTRVVPGSGFAPPVPTSNPPSYEGQGQYATPPYAPYDPKGAWQPSAPVPPDRPKKRRTTHVVVMLLIVAMLSGGVWCGVQVVKLMLTPESSDSSSGGRSTGVDDDSTLKLASTPKGDNSVAALAGALTPVQINEKMRNANVAVQIYGTGGQSSLMGEGSGVLIHEDSTKTYTYVVTCAHVIDAGNIRVSVELADGKSYDATIVGLDSRTDVGLLRIKQTGLEGATFGDSAELKVGEPVYAIGNPGGIEFMGSFTNGMVSSIDRSLSSTYKMTTIQHTAPINPGNSGGALMNAYGQVVGINSQKIVDTEYEGMGFAIPSKIVKEVVDGLIKNGYVPNRPKLGIQYMSASQTQAGFWVLRSNDLPSGSLIIAKIDADSVLSGTEVQVNDIITHVNGKALDKPDVLLQAVESGNVGDKLELTIARVNPDSYRVTSFKLSVKLVEDKGGSQPSVEETEPWYKDPSGFEW